MAAATQTTPIIPPSTTTTTTTTTTENHSRQSPRGGGGYFQIHYFSTASTYTGKQTEALPAPLPLSRLFRELESRYPGIRDAVLVSCGVSLGTEYVDVEQEEELELEQQQKKQLEQQGNAMVAGTGNGNGNGNGLVIQAGDEVAIIPPVSSG